MPDVPAPTTGAPAEPGPGQHPVTGGALAAFLAAQEGSVAPAGEEVEPSAPLAEAALGAQEPPEGEPEEATDQFAGLSPDQLLARARGLAGEVSRLRPAERDARRTVEVLQSRLQALVERLASAPPLAPAAGEPPAAPPDEQEDPLGYLLYTVKQLVSATQQGGEQTAEQRTQAAVVAALRTADDHVARFAAATPDYDPVVRAGLARAIEVAAAANPDATPQELSNGLTHYIHRLKLSELAAGRNPGDRLYRLAQSYLAGGSPAAPGQPNQVVNGGHRAGVPPSIAGVPGSSAGAAAATLADRIRTMDDATFDDEMGDVDVRTVDPRALFGADKVKTAQRG